MPARNPSHPNSQPPSLIPSRHARNAAHHRRFIGITATRRSRSPSMRPGCRSPMSGVMLIGWTSIRAWQRSGKNARLESRDVVEIR